MAYFSKNTDGSVREGFFFTIALHVLFQPAFCYLVTKITGKDWSLYFCLIQFIYVIPLLIVEWVNRKKMTCLSIVIASMLALMFNSLCGLGTFSLHH